MDPEEEASSLRTDTLEDGVGLRKSTNMTDISELKEEEKETVPNKKRRDTFPPPTEPQKRLPKHIHHEDDNGGQSARTHGTTTTNHESNDKVVAWLITQKTILCLWTLLFLVDLCLLTACILHLVKHNAPISHNSQITYRIIGDIFSVLYQCILLPLCWRFVTELLEGNFTQLELDHYYKMNDEIQQFARHRKKKMNEEQKIKWYEKVNYLLKDLELNQFTIAALLCAVHQLFTAALLWMAVYNGVSKWYILTGFSSFLGAFSITIPGICFHQFVILHHKEKNAQITIESNRLNDIEANPASIITDFSKFVSIKNSIFADGCMQILILAGFLIQLIRFCFVPALNHEDIVMIQSFIYDCEGDTKCDIRPDFVMCELILRIFVGMAIFNNLVLLSSILSDQVYTETSLTNIFKIFHPICYVVLLLALLMDLRITDASWWTVEYRVVHGVWIVVHLISVIVVFKLMCDFFTLNHRIRYQFTIVVEQPKALFVEAIILSILATLSLLFFSVDQELLNDFWKHGNIVIWRQWVMILYHISQIKVLHYANKIQKVQYFPKKLKSQGTPWEGCCGIRGYCVWLSFVNLYDFIFSFMFEAKEYDQVMDGNEIESHDVHKNIPLYKWSYSLSFAVCHLVLWSLCCSIEFIVKYDQSKREIYEEEKQKRLKRMRKRARELRDGKPKREMEVHTDDEEYLAHQSPRSLESPQPNAKNTGIKGYVYQE